jgi:hypothetical protein
MIETFLRHIQLEIRCKEFNNAKILYDTVLNVFASNTEIISYIVLEYAEFVLKYFRDLEFSKRLLKNYMDAYGFNLYLFQGCLQFYIKHVELKESNREIFDEFTAIVLVGLAKAQTSVSPKDYLKIKNIANHQMRNYLNTIYYIKSAERKIKEPEIRIDGGD